MKGNIENVRLNPDKFVKMLNNEGLNIKKEDASKLLLLFKKMARIVVRKYLEQ